MKEINLKSLALLAVVALFTVSNAQAKKADGEKRGEKLKKAISFEKMDTDEDGFLSFEEFTARPNKSKSESNEEKTAKRLAKMQEKFDTIDTDKDEQISKEEFGSFKSNMENQTKAKTKSNKGKNKKKK